MPVRSPKQTTQTGKKKSLLNLEEYVHFTLDYPKLNCAQCEENYNTDGIKPDCDQCPMPELFPENRKILDLYHAIDTQFVYDFQALPLVFEIYGIRCTRAEAKELLDKLTLIHQWKTDHKNNKT